MSTIRPHKHLILDATIIDPPKDETAMKAFLSDLIRKIKMVVAELPQGQQNPIAWYCNDKDNEGMTASAILTTSHVVLHVWDKIDVAELHFDLYSCSDFDPEEVLGWLNDRFEIIRGHGQIVNRRGRDKQEFDVNSYPHNYLEIRYS